MKEKMMERNYIKRKKGKAMEVNQQDEFPFKRVNFFQTNVQTQMEVQRKTERTRTVRRLEGWIDGKDRQI